MRVLPQAASGLTKLSEGLFLESYQDDAGIWTVGYGHTAGVKPGMVITEQQADDFLAQDLANAQAIVEKYVTVPLNDNQYGALVDFVFNVGKGMPGVKSGFVYLRNGQPSTLLKLINQGQYSLAAQQFALWNKCDGRVLNGLTARRKAEADLWNKPTNEA